MEINTDTPPYYPGQKIVRTGPSTTFLTKGAVYTCVECVRCVKCGAWHAHVTEAPADVSRAYRYRCLKCDTDISGKRPPYHSGFAENFAPLQKASADATAEILEKFKADEAGGVADVPVKQKGTVRAKEKICLLAIRYAASINIFGSIVG